MKYLKLYEAFQSTILSKTIGYLKNDSKSKFLNHVKKLCEEIDFPLSNLSDDYFQYLPFRKALSIIETENGGTIWKYWLDTEGKLIEVSSTDGKPTELDSKDGVIRSDEHFSYREEYMRVVNPKSGDWIWFKKSSHSNWELGKVFRSPFPDENYTDFIWFLNNQHDGSTSYEVDEFGKKWGEYGFRYSWGLYNDDFAYISKGIKVENDDQKINYKLYNKVGNKPLDDIDSQFAIVFRFDKLGSGEYKKGSEIKSEREATRSDATALISDEEIRKKNIEKRLLELSKKEMNIDNFDGLFQRAIFDKWILFFNKEMILNNINQIIDIIEGNENDGDEDGTYTKILQDWYATLKQGDKLKDDVLHFFNNQDGEHNVRSKLTLKHFNMLEFDQTNSIFLILKKLYNFKTDLFSREIKKGINTKQLSNKLSELGQLIIGKIKPNKFNHIDDVVITVERLKSIYNILTNSRYNFNRYWTDIIYYAKGLSAGDVSDNALQKYIDSIDKMVELVNKI